jgi:hypothetical protein
MLYRTTQKIPVKARVGKLASCGGGTVGIVEFGGRIEEEVEEMVTESVSEIGVSWG